MTQPKPPSDKKAEKAAKAIQRAIRKDDPAREPPTIGKPVIIDPDGGHPKKSSEGR